MSQSLQGRPGSPEHSGARGAVPTVRRAVPAVRRAVPAVPKVRRRRLAATNRPGTDGRRSWSWSVLVPFVLVLAGTLFVTSGVNAQGTDLRSGRYDDLAGLVSEQKTAVDRLLNRAGQLRKEVNALSARVAGGAVQRTQARVAALRGPAGLLPVSGPALTVTLDDAPPEVIDSANVDANQLIVHQQDLQAVVNALWAGGAEAMTLQGQRLISTTGIKCVGNTVVLQGVPYAPPYVITAVGDPTRMRASLAGSRYISIYRQYVEAYGLGWQLRERATVRLPGYSGSLEQGLARPAGAVAG